MPANQAPGTASRTSDQYVLRFETPGHRDRLKIQAIQGKRSLNKHILFLIEEGEKAQQSERSQA